MPYDVLLNSPKLSLLLPCKQAGRILFFISEKLLCMIKCFVLTIKQIFCVGNAKRIYIPIDKLAGTEKPRGLLPSTSKRLLGMCRWMGLHFHNWIDYNGVIVLVELLEWGRTFSGFLG